MRTIRRQGDVFSVRTGAAAGFLLLTVLLAGCGRAADTESVSIASASGPATTTTPAPLTTPPLTTAPTTTPTTRAPAPTTTRAAAPTTTRKPTPTTTRAAAAPRTQAVAPAPQTRAPQPAAAQAPARSTGCDPNYSGCVPIDSDVDCEGGKGNGPSYVRGPVRVIGKDIYGLDADKDGIGCE
ncbi:hypothetical protein [Pseudonocardia sp. WMMC193]|uniref:hypothetical protein n=1 Tax=Pseudonocardia sp. WMMC193 TaxID=2911965 RepID=UPI001F1B4C42|nr:hypothetical protein [Pseudonocardia sp. WMMC193]MCF7552008.1 hypothetical protein [Pseudonocardia sp. WMMC193]